MAIKHIQGFNHLPEITDYPAADLARDFLMDVDNGLLQYRYQDPVGITGIRDIDGKKYLELRNGTTSRYAYTGGLRISFDDTGLPKTGTYIFGFRVATGPNVNTSTGSFHKNLIGVQRIRPTSSWVSYIAPGANYRAYITITIEWRPGDSPVLGIYEDGVEVEYGTTADTTSFEVTIGQSEQRDALDDLITAFLLGDDPDSWVAFTDIYCAHNEEGTDNPTPQLGSIEVKPLPLASIEDGTNWTTSDGSKTVLEVLNEELLSDGSNAVNPFAISDSRGGVARFTLEPPAEMGEMLHVDFRALTNSTEQNQVKLQSSLSYYGLTGPVTEGFPTAEPEIRSLGNTDHPQFPSTMNSAQVGELELSVNSYSLARPNSMPFDTGPGPQVLQEGSPDLGYFGVVEGVFSRTELSTALGFFNEIPGDDTTFIKYVRRGKVCFIPILPLATRLTWPNINGDGLVDGSATIDLFGYTFKLRIPTGWENPAISMNYNNDYRLGVDNNTAERFTTLPMGAGGEIVDVFSRLTNMYPFGPEQWGDMPASYFGLNQGELHIFVKEPYTLPDTDFATILSRDGTEFVYSIRAKSAGGNGTIGVFVVLELVSE